MENWPLNFPLSTPMNEKTWNNQFVSLTANVSTFKEKFTKNS
jgi:hypothetical protein